MYNCEGWLWLNGNCREGYWWKKSRIRVRLISRVEIKFSKYFYIIKSVACIIVPDAQRVAINLIASQLKYCTVDLFCSCVTYILLIIFYVYMNDGNERRTRAQCNPFCTIFGAKSLPRESMKGGDARWSRCEYKQAVSGQVDRRRKCLWKMMDADYLIKIIRDVIMVPRLQRNRARHQALQRQWL